MLTDGPLFVEPRALIRNLPLLLSEWKAQYLMWRSNEPPAFLAVSLKQLAAGWVRLFEGKFTEDDFIKFICGKSSLSILMQTLWASIEISETASERMKNHEVFTGKANRRRSGLSISPLQRVAIEFWPGQPISDWLAQQLNSLIRKTLASNRVSWSSTRLQRPFHASQRKKN